MPPLCSGQYLERSVVAAHTVPWICGLPTEQSGSLPFDALCYRGRLGDAGRLTYSMLIGRPTSNSQFQNQSAATDAGRPAPPVVTLQEVLIMAAGAPVPNDGCGNQSLRSGIVLQWA